MSEHPLLLPSCAGPRAHAALFATPLKRAWGCWLAVLAAATVTLAYVLGSHSVARCCVAASFSCWASSGLSTPACTLSLVATLLGYSSGHLLFCSFLSFLHIYWAASLSCFTGTA